MEHGGAQTRIHLSGTGEISNIRRSFEARKYKILFNVFLHELGLFDNGQKLCVNCYRLQSRIFLKMNI